MTIHRPRILECQTLVDCDCNTIVYADGSGVEIGYCDLHYAAFDLLAACEALLAAHKNSEILAALAVNEQSQAYAAIAKAKGKEK